MPYLSVFLIFLAILCCMEPDPPKEEKDLTFTHAAKCAIGEKVMYFSYETDSPDPYQDYCNTIPKE
jgi:hypothetical protein